MKTIEKTVRNIIADVKKRGDRAVIEYTRRFDSARLTPKTIKIAPSALKKAWEKAPPEIKKAIKAAKKNIESFHRIQMPRNREISPETGVRLGQIFRPIEKVGVYIPGGRSPLVSTVLMTVVPAAIAGVRNIIVATPPPVNKYILAACWAAGSVSVYQAGGAQAIAALAYGTKTIPKVDKIVGPGNVYVTAAKKMVFGDVGIDMPAGPSEILIIADKTARKRFIEADLLSQLEHDPMAKAVLITTSGGINVPGVKTIHAASLKDAARICNELAPEHVELMVKNPEALARKIKNAGIILQGHYTPASVTDFIAGTNHVLPTGGSAKAFAGLSVWDFLRPVSTVRYTKKALLRALPYIKIFSEIEGLKMHRLSAEERKR